MTNPNEKEKHRRKGELLKRDGIARAATAKNDRVSAAKLAMLDALLCSADGTATIDDATANLGEPFEDGGKWRGNVTRSLAARGIIERVSYVESDRPSRHRGTVSRWRLVDRAKAIELRSRLRAALNVKNPSAGTDGRVSKLPHQKWS